MLKLALATENRIVPRAGVEPALRTTDFKSRDPAIT